MMIIRSLARPWRQITISRQQSSTSRGLCNLAATRPLRPSPLRQAPAWRTTFVPRKRHESSLSIPGAPEPSPPDKTDQPSYELSFTCKPCLFRSTHRVTKHGYHHGTVLVTCPSCKSRHVISDHLKVFMDKKSTLEDILRRKAAEGEDFTKLLKKGTLGRRTGQLIADEGDEDLEFWEDGTQSTHVDIEEKQAQQDQATKG